MDRSLILEGEGTKGLLFSEAVSAYRIPKVRRDFTVGLTSSTVSDSCISHTTVVILLRSPSLLKFLHTTHGNLILSTRLNTIRILLTVHP